MDIKNENKRNEILVLGSTGKTGSRVAKRLAGLGLPIRMGSRSASPAFDWEDSKTWIPSLQNIDAVYISFQPDLALPGAVETIRSFAKTAADWGVKKLVLLSGRGEVEALQCEQAVIDAGIAYTIVRASWFSQNFSEGNFLEPVLAGYVQLPAGNVGEPFIDVDDIADVAVAALTDDKHNGQIYEVTGPRLLTFKDAVEEISKVTGKAIQYEEIPMSAYAGALSEYGLPNEVIHLITYLFTEVLDGRNATTADGVERALGRKPADFTQYAIKTAATGIWG
jgi:uncharacterized protein YbjT (DUF2867 family)